MIKKHQQVCFKLLG